MNSIPYFRFLREENLWQTIIPGYSDHYRLLHDDAADAFNWMIDKILEIKKRGWYEYKGECPGRDSSCPCHDGDACHYKDYPGTKAWMN